MKLKLKIVINMAVENAECQDSKFSLLGSEIE